MNVEIDSDSPVPPWHQLAPGIRYRIAVGELGPGDDLPSLRGRWPHRTGDMRFVTVGLDPELPSIGRRHVPLAGPDVAGGEDPSHPGPARVRDPGRRVDLVGLRG